MLFRLIPVLQALLTITVGRLEGSVGAADGGSAVASVRCPTGRLRRVWEGQRSRGLFSVKIRPLAMGRSALLTPGMSLAVCQSQHLAGQAAVLRGACQASCRIIGRLLARCRRLIRSLAIQLLSLEAPCQEKRGRGGLKRRTASIAPVVVLKALEAAVLPCMVVTLLRRRSGRMRHCKAVKVGRRGSAVSGQVFSEKMEGRVPVYQAKDGVEGPNFASTRGLCQSDLLPNGLLSVSAFLETAKGIAAISRRRATRSGQTRGRVAARSRNASAVIRLICASLGRTCLRHRRQGMLSTLRCSAGGASCA